MYMIDADTKTEGGGVHYLANNSAHTPRIFSALGCTCTRTDSSMECTVQKLQALQTAIEGGGCSRH